MGVGWLLLAALATAQVITAPAPVRSPWERGRTVPPATAPKNLGGLTDAPLHPELRAGTMKGRVRVNGKPVAGARVISVVDQPARWIRCAAPA